MLPLCSPRDPEGLRTIEFDELSIGRIKADEELVTLKGSTGTEHDAVMKSWMYRFWFDEGM